MKSEIRQAIKKYPFCMVCLEPVEPVEGLFLLCEDELCGEYASIAVLMQQALSDEEYAASREKILELRHQIHWGKDNANDIS